jgi:formate hydrogenlyase transcriptional activator
VTPETARARIEAAHSERDLAFAREQLQAALEIQRAVAGHLERRALFTAVAEALQRVLPVSRVILFLPSVDAEVQPDTLRVYAANGRDGVKFYEGETVPRATTMAGWVVEHHRPLTAGRAEEIREPFPTSYERVREEGMESIAVLPLLVGGRCVGCLTLMAVEIGAFEALPERFLEEIAASVAVALDSSIVYSEVSNLRDELRALLDVNQAVTRHLRRDELFVTLARCLHGLLPFDRFGIELPVEGDRLRAHVLTPFGVGAASGQGTGGRQAAPLEPGIAQVEELPAAGTACQWVGQNQQWLVASSPEELRERFPITYEVMTRERMASLCALPLVTGQRCLGVLFFMATGEEAYRDVRRGLLDQVASAVAVALDNCLVYEELRALRDRLAAENLYLQEEIRQDHDFREIVGRSPTLLRLLAAIGAVAPTDSTVLILGETGTGKELIARAIHDRSRRRDRPLVKVNCSAISAGLVESELFGHVRGAFTGAMTSRVGRFELADHGTIFLDEIGDLPLDTQVKLLRVLQEREFEPVGSSQSRRVDVRVIAATNRDLEKGVAEGWFRADLYYRLNVLPLRVPPLRDRAEDIPLLAGFFADRCGRDVGKAVAGLTQDATDALVAYSWPGNIRELQNVIERAVVLAQSVPVRIDRDLLPGLPARPGAEPESGPVGRPVLASAAPFASPPASGGAIETLEVAERRHIEAALDRCGWRVEGARGAATALAMNPSTLRSRMKKLGIVRRRP